jgi:hypothetical protein
MTPLRSLADLVAVVPYLLGFHPTDSMVVLGLRDKKIIFEVRGDLPPRAELTDFVGYYAALVARQRCTSAVLLGYGDGPRVTPVVLALRSALAAHRVEVLDALRVAEGRYWSYLCTAPACCPVEGRRYDASVSPAAAAAVVEGCVALPSRTALERRFAPVEGAARQAMAEATDRADRRLTELVESAPADPGRPLRAAGVAAVDRAVSAQRAGARLTDDELAWLSVALVYLPVRDYAWERVGGDLTVHVGLWTEVTRRADPDLSVAPATLLAFAAWRAGEGAIAAIALDRVLRQDPTYRMAQLLREALAGGISPAEWTAALEQPSPPARRRSTRRRPVRT